MSFIVHGNEPYPYLGAVFAYDLVDTRSVIDVMVDPILHALPRTSNEQYAWFIFQDGKLLPSSETQDLVAKATVKAKELEVVQERIYAQELKQKAEEADKRQEASERKQYEWLKAKFEVKEVSQ